MTIVRVDSGICGFTTTITVRNTEDRNLLSVSLDSECEMVRGLAGDARHLKHVACPVPSGILKALEVEAGLCIPRDAHIVFCRET
jgi:hypothetical protein